MLYPKCSKCNGEVIVYDANDPSKTFCPQCCPMHDYYYERWERGYFCKICGERAPDDYRYYDGY